MATWKTILGARAHSPTKYDVRSSNCHNDELGFGPFVTRTDQQPRNIAKTQFQMMSIVPRLFGDGVQPCRLASFVITQAVLFAQVVFAMQRVFRNLRENM